MAEALGHDWVAHAAAQYGSQSAQRSAADFACIDWLKPWREAVPGDLSTEARTRLGLDGIDLDLPVPPVSPFGHRIERLTLPAWMLKQPPVGDDASPPVVVEDLQALGGRGFTFSVRGDRFRYDRHGLAPEPTGH